MKQMRKSTADYAELPTADLEQLLRHDCDGTHELPGADILAICEILAQRQSASQSAQHFWQQFLHCYAPHNHCD